MGRSSENLKQELLSEHPSTSANVKNTLRKPISFLPRKPSLQAHWSIKAWEQSIMSDPTFSEPGKAISHDHEWVIIHWERGREREGESRRGGAFPISNRYWRDSWWCVLMSGMNFSKMCMRLIIKHHRTQQKLDCRFIWKTRRKKKSKLHTMVCHSSLGMCLFTIPKRGWPPSYFVLTEIPKAGIYDTFFKLKMKEKWMTKIFPWSRTQNEWQISDKHVVHPWRIL